MTSQMCLTLKNSTWNTQKRKRKRTCFKLLRTRLILQCRLTRVLLFLVRMLSLEESSGALWVWMKNTVQIEYLTLHFPNRELQVLPLVQPVVVPPQLPKYNSLIISSQILIRSLTKLPSSGIAQVMNSNAVSSPSVHLAVQLVTELITILNHQKHTLRTHPAWLSLSQEAPSKRRVFCSPASEPPTHASFSSPKSSTVLRKKMSPLKTMKYL